MTLNLTGSSTYSGVSAGKVAVVQNGASTSLLSGTNTYTGNTTINGGILELAAPGLSAQSTVTVASARSAASL